MSTFQTALDALASITVLEIHRNYAINQLPDALTRAQLPALLILPLDSEKQRFFPERGSGFETVAFANGRKHIRYALTHLLLIAPEKSGSGLHQHLPHLISCIDAYFLALADDLTLDDSLLEPPQVRVETGIFDYGGVSYIGCAFRHSWLIGI